MGKLWRFPALVSSSGGEYECENHEAINQQLQNIVACFQLNFNSVAIKWFGVVNCIAVDVLMENLNLTRISCSIEVDLFAQECNGCKLVFVAVDGL